MHIFKIRHSQHYQNTNNISIHSSTLKFIHKLLYFTTKPLFSNIEFPIYHQIHYYYIYYARPRSAKIRASYMTDDVWTGRFHLLVFRYLRFHIHTFHAIISWGPWGSKSDRSTSKFRSWSDRLHYCCIRSATIFQADSYKRHINAWFQPRHISGIFSDLVVVVSCTRR